MSPQARESCARVAAVRRIEQAVGHELTNAIVQAIEDGVSYRALGRILHQSHTTIYNRYHAAKAANRERNPA